MTKIISNMEKSTVGSLTVITGCMFAGKTTELINRYHQVKEDVIAFKPVIDNRYSQSEIVSHKGKKIMATRIKNFTEINNYSQSNIFIDEIHFFQEDIVFYLNQLAKAGKKITVAGLS